MCIRDRDTFIRYATPDSCNNFVTIIASIADCDSNIVVVTNNSPYGLTTGRNASGYYPCLLYTSRCV